MTTIYSELLAAAGTAFLPQAEGEPDGHYLRRLVLAVSKASDSDWERLSKDAQDWYNAQAKRVKAHQYPEECPGFAHEPCIEEILRFTAEEQYLLLNGTPEGRARAAAWRKEFGIPEPTVTGPDEVEMENRIKDAATPFVGRKIDDEMVEELTNVVDAVIDAGWPEKPSPQQIMDSVTTTLDEDLKTPMFHEWPIVDVHPQYVKMVDEIVNSKHTATDAVRALVMLHTDWNQAQIMRELESQGRVVSIGTIATVRSMTLATIAVAKRLGKWVER